MRAYLDILRIPGALAFSAAGMFARFPGAMVTLATVFMVQGIYGSYALAGATCSAIVISLALASPVLARLVDRHGQARIMRPALAVALSSLAGLIGIAVAHMPAWMLFPPAICFGATLGNLGALVRARWGHLLEEDRRLHAAFALESAIDEACFVIAPLFATWLATAVHPAAGLIVCAVLLGMGGWTFLAQRRTEPPARPLTDPGHDGVRGLGVITLRGMWVVIGVMVCMGVVFASWDVTAVALFEALGHKDRVGVFLALIAGASCVGGLSYGAVSWRSSLTRRFVVTTLLSAVGCGAFLLVNDHLWAFGMACVLTGLFVSPTIINANTLAQRLVPPGALTEGLAWVGVAVNVGAALGAPVAGAIVDHTRPGLGFVVTTLAGLAAVAFAIVGQRALLTR